MLEIILGGFFAKWLDGFLKSSTVSTNKNIVFVNKINADVLDRLYSFLEVYEGYHDIAYDLKDGKITIGYGTTQWLDGAGRAIRPVRMGDTITRDQAKQQVVNFFIPVIKNVEFYCTLNKIAISADLMVALLNFCYMGGIGFMNYDCTKRIMQFGNGNGDNDMVSEKLKKEIVGWLKGIKFRPGESRCRAGVTHKYQCFGLGWSRRIAASVDLVKGVKRNKKWYDQNIKKPY